MIDALDFPDTLKRAVLQLGPEAAHLLDLYAAGLRGIENPRLGGEARGFQLAGGGQDVGVMIALITFAVRRMDRHINGHAIAADQFLGEVAGDLGAVLGADLGRQGQFPFAGGDGVATGLAGLDLVPEAGPILRPIRRVLRGQDEGLLDALLAGVIVDAAFALALDALSDTVGRCRRGRAPGAAFDRLHGEVVAGHAPSPRQ